MNAGQLLGTLMNGLRPASGQNPAVELIPGQIFRGVIVKAFPGDLVQVQLGGLSLYAQLNAPLEVGQTAWLQVLPRSHPITLRVIDAPSGNAAHDQGNESLERSSLEGLLRGLGLKADRVNLHLLNQVMKAGIAIKSGEIGGLLEILKKSPALERTMQAVQLAQLKGLPLEAEVIRSLETVLFGKSIDAHILNLLNIAKENPAMKPIADKMEAIWQKARDATAPIPHPLTQSAAKPETGSHISMQTSMPLPSEISGTGVYDQKLPSMRIENDLRQGTEERQHVRVPPQGSEMPASFLRRWISLLGVQYEHNLLHKLNSSLAGMENHLDEVDHLKGILLALRGSENLPQHVREAIDEGIRWITGQQLLLSNEGNTPWSSFIFQIPLFSLSGNSETAFIQIEGRKRGNDAIDPENCRLFFHLNLEALQKTLIDMQIQNRIMSIQIYNDSSWLKEWIERHREEWSEPLQELGYHLSSLKVSPLPQQETRSELPYPDHLPVSRGKYQGVDLRV